MKTIKNIFWLALLGLLFLACAKDGQDGAIGPTGPQGEQGIAGTDGQDGAIGPAGPQGEQGISGADGVDGEQGSQGETGTANVIYSEWFPSQFADDIEANNSTFSVSAPELTEDITENGVVLAFGRHTNISSGITVVDQLPFSSFSLNQHYFHRYTIPPASNAEQVFISLGSIDLGPIGAPYFDDYRYVIIPGGIPVSGKSAIDYSKMSYEEIATLFSIED